MIMMYQLLAKFWQHSKLYCLLHNHIFSENLASEKKKITYHMELSLTRCMLQVLGGFWRLLPAFSPQHAVQSYNQNEPT